METIGYHQKHLTLKEKTKGSQRWAESYHSQGAAFAAEQGGCIWRAGGRVRGRSIASHASTSGSAYCQPVERRRSPTCTSASRLRHGPSAGTGRGYLSPQLSRQRLPILPAATRRGFPPSQLSPAEVTDRLSCPEQCLPIVSSVSTNDYRSSHLS